LALLRSSWLQNFYLAIWLLFGSFATFRSTNFSWRRVASGACSLFPPP